MKSKRLKIDPQKQIGGKSNAPLFIFLGFAAVLSVVVLGYIRFTSSTNEEAAGLGVRSGVVVEASMPVRERVKAQIRSELPSGGKNMVHPQENTLYGRWYITIAPEGIAEFTFLPSGYELIYVDGPKSYIRKFSKGRYTYDPQTGEMGLFPQKDAKPSAQYSGVEYKIMTMRNYQLILYQNPEEPSLYMVAPERDLAGKNYHPLFMYKTYDGAPVLRFEPVVAGAK